MKMLGLHDYAVRVEVPDLRLHFSPESQRVRHLKADGGRQ